MTDYNIDLIRKDYFVKISSISVKDVIDDIYYDDVSDYWKHANNSIKRLIMKDIDQLCDYLLASERIAQYISIDKYIVFREWIEYKVEEEFRCFIKGGKLVAISQYDYGNALPEHMKCEKLIVKAIDNFIKQLEIPHLDIVIDVAFHLDDMNVYFIEFNSFGLKSDTDAALYDWVHDRKILMGKCEGIDIRLFNDIYIERKYRV